LVAVRHRVALLSTVLAMVAATLALPGRASAVEPGFQVAITEVPGTFTAGARARTVTVVASSELNRCQKVRWSLIMQVSGPDLDEIEVARVEDNGSFPVQVETSGADTARITDVRLDPGQLCRGRTVTARYQVAFDDNSDSGQVLFQAQAFNAGRTLLQETTARSKITGEEPEAEPTKTPSEKPSPSKSASPEPEESATGEQADEPEPAKTQDNVAAVPASGSGGTPSLLGPGLIVGGILVFLGVGLLMRLRLRNRAPKHSQVPTGFYPTH
jgi:hypothetical protein